MKNILMNILAILLLVACNKKTSESPDDRFIAAMIDASRVLTQDDIYSGLVSLKYGESPLVDWRIEGKDTMLLVATLQCSDWEYAQIDIGGSAITGSSLDNTIWVAIPNELNQKLQSEDIITDSLTLNNRMLELLGLRPDGTESVVNLLWIDKNSLLRPSYDSNPTTTFGAINFPSIGELPSGYREWFEANIAYSYESPKEGLNYPFTRLGYTYDWGDGKSRYGVSEFITLPSTTIELEGRIDCWTYYKEMSL